MDEFEYIKHLGGEYDRRQVVRDLMAAYGKDVWNFAYSIVQKPDAADDISQNVFLKVFEKLDTYRGGSTVKTWILSITRNEAYDLRKSAFWRKVKLVPHMFEHSKQYSESAEHAALDRAAANQIWELTLKLSAKYREVLVLSAHHHLSNAEIAELLQIAEGTVKTRLHRARLKMQEQLQRGETYA